MYIHWCIEFVNKTLQIHKMLSTFTVIKTIHEHTRMHRVSNTVYFLTIRILLSQCVNFVIFTAWTRWKALRFHSCYQISVVTSSHFSLSVRNTYHIFIFYYMNVVNSQYCTVSTCFHIAVFYKVSEIISLGDQYVGYIGDVLHVGNLHMSLHNQ